MTAILLLIVMAFLVWLVMVVLGGTMGASFNRFNPFIRSATSDSIAGDHTARKLNRKIPACGRCGYPARGISGLECPECGADLREVGIVTPKNSLGGSTGCLVPLLFTIAAIIMAILLAPVYAKLIPRQSWVQFEHVLVPDSSEYQQAQIKTRAVETFSSSDWSSYNLSSGYSSGSYGGSLPRSLHFSSIDPKATVQFIEVDVLPDPGHASRGGTLLVDPGRTSFSYRLPAGNEVHTSRKLNQTDVLDFLKACGADVNAPKVQSEAQDLYTVIDGLGRGYTSFNLSALGLQGEYERSGANDDITFWQRLYSAGWFLFWLTGLFLIYRRSRRRDLLSPSEQTTNKN